MALNVYFATNRLIKNERTNPEFTDKFHPNLDELRFGKVAFTGSELFKQDLKTFIDAGQITVAPEKIDAADADKSKLGSKAIFNEVRAEMLAKRDALILIHGYNYTFREAAGRAAQMQQWLAGGGKDLVMLMFSWPSEGGGVGTRTYHDDRKRAEASGPALARAILKAADFIRTTPRNGRCDGRIHLMCHSMGNWALRGAVQGMRTYVGNNIPPLFDEVLLMAADEDDDTLQQTHKIAPLLRGCRRTTVYYNHQDLALKASDYAMGNPDRLGRSGPGNPAGLSDKVTVVNVSTQIVRDLIGDDAWQNDLTGHQYYRNNPRVLQDMAEVLDGKLDEDFLIAKERRKNDFGDYLRLE